MKSMLRTLLVAGAGGAIVACSGGGGTTNPGPTAPVLTLSTTSVTFDPTQAGSASLPAAKTIAVTNSGGGTLAVPTLSVDYGSGVSGWLDHSLAASGAGYTITLRPNTTALSATTHTATVQVASAGAAGSPKAVTLSWPITANPNPVIAVDPLALSFTGQIGLADPATQTITVGNVGGGTLDPITVATNASWLSASVSGATVTVGASVGALAAGSYSGTVTITSANAANSPLSYPVTFTVNQPVMQVAPAGTLSFATNVGTSPPARTLTVTNVGTGTLTAPTPSDDETWLSATVSGSDPTYAVSVSVDATGLVEGTYVGTVTLTSAGAAGSPATVPVQLVVGQPALQVSPASLAFTTNVGVAPAAKALTFSNTGTGTLVRPTVTDDATWLSASAVSGSDPTFTVNVSVDPTGLATGAYSATITVTSAGSTGSPATIPVTLDVYRPTMQVSPTSLSFSTTAGSSPAAKGLTVTNTGTGVLAAPNVSDNASWLSATVSGADPTYTVTVTVSSAALAAGSYSATLTITSPGASNSPTVAVSLTVSGGTVVVDTSTIGSAFTTINAKADERYAECFKLSPKMIADDATWAATTANALTAAKAAGRIDYSRTQADACAAAIAGATCAEIDQGVFPACAAMLIGLVANGDGCYSSDECANGWCSSDATLTCPGSCTAFRTVGASCSTWTECGDNVCLWTGTGNNYACAVRTGPGAQGQACGNDWPACQLGLYCAGTTCELRRTLGQSCTSDSACVATLGCSGSNQCQPWAGVGESCSGAPCGWALYCNYAGGTTCAEYPRIGESCAQVSCWEGYCGANNMCAAGTVAVGGTCDNLTLFCVNGAFCDWGTLQCVADPAASGCY